MMAKTRHLIEAALLGGALLLGCSRADKEASRQVVATIEVQDVTPEGVRPTLFAPGELEGALAVALDRTGFFNIRLLDPEPPPEAVGVVAEVILSLAHDSKPAPLGEEGIARVAISLELEGLGEGPGHRVRGVAERAYVPPVGQPDRGSRAIFFRDLVARAFQDVTDRLVPRIKLDKASLEELLRLLESPEEGVRDMVVQRLGEHRDPKAVEALMGALEDESEDVSLHALGSLVSLGDERAVPALIDMNSRQRHRFDAQILYAIGSIGGREAEAYLFTVSTGHPIEGVRDVAKEALEALRRRGPRPDEGSDR